MSDPGLPGAELARRFFAEAVAPLLSVAMPGLRYAAARLGSGSDVLGLDDALSRDHDWGCRLTLLVDADAGDQVPRVRRLLEDELPERFAGFPVRFPVTWDPSVTHKVDVATVADFAASRLGTDPTQGMSVIDWLTVTGQSVLEVTAGPVFADRTRTLAPARALLAWYPPDVERYVLAAGWQRLCQLMPFLGRTAESGDELGSRLLSAGLAADVVSLAFLLSRRWAPYPKWRGTVFRSLPVAARLGPLADTVVAAPGWREREDALAAACEVLLRVQRERGHPAPASAVIPFFSRPYRTVDGAVLEGLLAGITDPDVARLPLVGSIEQWADSTDVLSSPGRRAGLQAAYRAWAAAG
jgi:Domain of unknown function (DUF4037)